MHILEIVGRNQNLFTEDLKSFKEELDSSVQNNSFLVIGGGGTIGQAVTKELFKRKAKILHVVDLNENYLVELVRDIRSAYGHAVTDFDTFALDCGSDEFEIFLAKGNYDIILNLSAMKHVRSENCPFSMYRMLKTNLFNTLKTYEWAEKYGSKKYFCVSTDKAANPANFMGASKRAMELCLMRSDLNLPLTAARFANVAFSNGSLLEGFRYRIEKQQPLSAPQDISRFFISPEESGIICLFATILGQKNQIFFPYNDTEINLMTFKKVAENYILALGKEPIVVTSEEEARAIILKVDLDRFWPINCFESDTAGEKPFEEFYTPIEHVDYGRFQDLATIEFVSKKSDNEVQLFYEKVRNIDLKLGSSRDELLKVVKEFVPTFTHVSRDKFLNSRM